MGPLVHHTVTTTLLPAATEHPTVVPAQRRAPATGGGPIDLLPTPAGAADGQYVHVTLHLAGRAVLRRKGAELPLTAGDLVISSGPHPEHLLRSGDCTGRTYRVPCGTLGISAAEIRAAGTLLAPGSTGHGALASRFLTALAEWSDDLGALARIRLARSAADLLALVVADLLDQDQHDPADDPTALAARVRDHIERNLTDPELSPESVARAHAISVRYLHKLFQRQGTTVGRWIRHRRLEACRRELDRPPHRRLPVAVVAGRWGFASASHFSRVFREAYGLTPTQWQTRGPIGGADGEAAERRGADGSR
ncbi:helix-turn-helix domain-containing protein [Kitasatospora sp. NPDC004531]